MLNERIPVGTIAIFPGTTLPKGWRLCNGQHIKKADLPLASFNNLANTLGLNPDEVGKIPLPNLTNRFIVGAGNAFKVGEKGEGQHVHKLPPQGGSEEYFTAQDGLHSHACPSNWYTHNTSSDDSGEHYLSSKSPHISDVKQGGKHRHGFLFVVPEKKTNPSNYNRPKYIILNYIIKVG